MAQVYQTVGGGLTANQNVQFQGRLITPGSVQISGEADMSVPVGIAVYSLNTSVGSLYFRMQQIREKTTLVKSIKTEATVIADITEDGSVSAIELLLTDKEIVNGIKANS